jgi:hypothetical protein
MPMKRRPVGVATLWAFCAASSGGACADVWQFDELRPTTDEVRPTTDEDSGPSSPEEDADPTPFVANDGGPSSLEAVESAAPAPSDAGKPTTVVEPIPDAAMTNVEESGSCHGVCMTGVDCHRGKCKDSGDSNGGG